MIQPGLAVQQAMGDVLVARASLTTLLGGAFIFDELPRGVAAPYVHFNQIEKRDWSTADQKAHESFVTLEIASNARSRVQAQSIIQEIEAALDGVGLTLEGHALINLRCIFISAMRQKVTGTFSATLRFRAATEPLES